MTELEPIDVAIIEKLQHDYRYHDGSFLAQLIAAFEQEIADLDTVVVPIPEKGRRRLSPQVQRLKTAARTLGAGEVVTLCERIQLAERLGNPGQAFAILIPLRSALRHAVDALRRLARDGTSKPGA